MDDEPSQRWRESLCVGTGCVNDRRIEPCCPCPASVWSLRLERRPGGVVVLSWPAVTGKVFRVQHAPSLSQPFQAMGPEWQSAPPENVVTNPASGREAYYRVKAE